MSIKRLLLLPLLLLALVPALLVAMLGLYQQTTTGTAAVQAQAAQLATRVERASLEQFKRPVALLQLLASSPPEENQAPIDANDPRGLENRFWDFALRNPDVARVLFASEQGALIDLRRIASDRADITLGNVTEPFVRRFRAQAPGDRSQALMPLVGMNDPRSERWYLKVRNGNGEDWTLAETQGQNGGLRLVYARALHDRNGNLVGVIAAEFKLSDIGQIERALIPSGGATAILLDRSDQPIARSSNAEPDVAGAPAASTIVQASQPLGSSSDLGWRVVVTVPTGNVASGVELLMTGGTAAVLLLLALALLGGERVSHRLALELADEIQQIRSAATEPVRRVPSPFDSVCRTSEATEAVQAARNARSHFQDELLDELQRDSISVNLLPARGDQLTPEPAPLHVLPAASAPAQSEPAFAEHPLAPTEPEPIPAAPQEFAVLEQPAAAAPESPAFDEEWPQEADHAVVQTPVEAAPAALLNELQVPEQTLAKIDALAEPEGAPMQVDGQVEPAAISPPEALLDAPADELPGEPKLALQSEVSMQAEVEPAAPPEAATPLDAIDEPAPVVLAPVAQEVADDAAPDVPSPDPVAAAEPAVVENIDFDSRLTSVSPAALAQAAPEPIAPVAVEFDTHIDAAPVAPPPPPAIDFDTQIAPPPPPVSEPVSDPVSDPEHAPDAAPDPVTVAHEMDEHDLPDIAVEADPFPPTIALYPQGGAEDAQAHEAPVAEPVASPSEQIASESLTDVPPLTGCEPQALLLEDNPINERLLDSMLRKLGCLPTTVHGVAAAADAVAQGHFDIILVGSHRSDPGGMPTTKLLRKLISDPTVRLVSIRTRFAIEPVTSDIDFVLAPPVRIADLKRAIEAPLQRPSATATAPQNSAEMAPLLDVKIINQLKALDAQAPDHFMREVIEQFVGGVPETLNNVKRFASEGTWLAVARSAHQLRGGSLTLGARRLEQICKKIEEAADDGLFATANELLGDFEQAALLTMEALTAVAQEFSPSAS